MQSEGQSFLHGPEVPLSDSISPFSPLFLFQPHWLPLDTTVVLPPQGLCKSCSLCQQPCSPSICTALSLTSFKCHLSKPSLLPTENANIHPRGHSNLPALLSFSPENLPPSSTHYVFIAKYPLLLLLPVARPCSTTSCHDHMFSTTPSSTVATSHTWIWGT